MSLGKSSFSKVIFTHPERGIFSFGLLNLASKPLKNLLQLQEDHKKRLISKKLSTPYAIALLDYLFERPHLSITDVADHFKIYYQGAKALVDQFVTTEILKEITGKKRDKRYSYWEYLAFLSEGT